MYVPMLYGAGDVNVNDTKSGVNTAVNVHALCPIKGDPVPVNWDNAQLCEIDESDLEKDVSAPGGIFGDLPSIAAKAKTYDGWTKDFANWMYRSQTVSVLKSPSSGLFSSANESERDFRLRLQQSNREARDNAVEALRKKYAVKISALEERLRRAQQAEAVQAEQAKAAKMQTAISLGATLLGGLLGRKTVSVGNLGRATAAARGVARSMKESTDVARANETVEAVAEQLKELNAQLESEIAQMTAASDPAAEKLETIVLKPKKKDISIKLVALVWAPHITKAGGPPEPAW